MALKITEGCINCAACEIECPYQAIFPGGVNWRAVENKYLHFCRNTSIKDDFVSDSHYYIVPDECTECVGISDIPKCIMVCPIAGIMGDEKHIESLEHLFAKKEYLDTMHPWNSWV